MKLTVCYLLASSLVLLPYAGFGNTSDSSARMVPRDGSANYAVLPVDASHNPVDQLTIIGVVSLLITGFLAGFVTRSLANSRKGRFENEENSKTDTNPARMQSTRIEVQHPEAHVDDNLEKIRRFKEWIKENAEQPETGLRNNTDTKN